MVLEYIENGSLERIIKKYGPIQEGLLRRFMKQVGGRGREGNGEKDEEGER